jgi:hypothetical protein
MCQPRTEIVGSSFLELKSDLTVSDDRLFTFLNVFTLFLSKKIKSNN